MEIRCPVGLRRLFMKLRLADEQPAYTEGNLLEIACADCRRELRRQGVEATLVLHRYDFAGELVETVNVRADMPGVAGDADR